MKSTIFLIALGILLAAIPLSTNNSTLKDGTIILTEDNHVFFSGRVDEASVAKASIELGQLSEKLSDNDTIYLVLDTPGGSVVSGNQFIDFGKSIPQKIKPISIFAASMGYHMFQSFDERIMQVSSTIMSHRVSLSGLSGQVPGELVTRLNSIISTSNQMDDVAAKRVGLTRIAYQQLIHDELWLNGLDAVKTGHADRIAKLRCSNDLIKGTRVEAVDTIFGPVDVTFSTCPLITGYLSFKFNKMAQATGTSSYIVPRNEAEVVREIRNAKRKINLEAW